MPIEMDVKSDKNLAAITWYAIHLDKPVDQPIKSAWKIEVTHK